MATHIRAQAIHEQTRPNVSGKPLHLAFAEAEARLDELHRLPPEILRFRFFEAPFTARLTSTAFGRGTLHLQATLGTVPYTAEDASARRHALRYLRTCRLDAHDRLSLRPDGSVHFESTTVIDLPADRAGLVSQVTILLLAISPLLEPLSGCLKPPVDTDA